MNLKIVFAVAVTTIFIACFVKSKKGNMTDDKNENSITEVPKNDSEEKVSSEKATFDFVVSEAAVGSINGVTFTVAGFEESEDSNSAWETYLDIDKSKFVDVMDGTIFNLDETTRVQVIKLEKDSDDSKGKIYFKILK